MHDPVYQLLAVWIVIHIVDGAVLIRRPAIVFSGWGQWYRVQSGSKAVFGNARKALVILRPWPPFESGFVTEIPELTVTSTAVLPYAVQRPGRKDPPDAWSPLDAECLASAQAEHMSVLGIDCKADTSSILEAERLAAACRDFAAASTEEDRKALFHHRVQASHDVLAIRARYADFGRESALIGVLGPVAWLVSLGSFIGFFYVPAMWAHWYLFVLVTVALWVHVLVEFSRVHRRFYPTAVGDRVTKLFMLGVSLPALAHARTFLARDLFVGFHPLAVGCVLLRGPTLHRFAADIWNDVKNPTHGIGTRSEAEVERQAMIRSHRALLENEGLGTQSLEAIPDEWAQRGFLGLCPRCRSVYEVAEGTCSDCVGVALVKTQ
ncbi:MAG: hypothetical protein KTR25_02625 [Myxococcales bacterium]|nr:hypothetical protein [Myxococcales bacterium]